VAGVPLFAGFMYASVGSYICQAWRRFDLRVSGYHPIRATIVALAIYLNFFTHYWFPDMRWLLALVLILVLPRCLVHFTVGPRRYRMPLSLSFVLIGAFLWASENAATFLDAWRYPNQTSVWRVVHADKLGAWALLVSLSFVLVASVKSQEGRLYHIHDARGKPDDGPGRRCHGDYMEIREVDVFDDAQLGRLHEVTERAQAFERPHHTRWSLAEAKLEYRRDDPTERAEAWAAYDEGTMVGVVSLWFPLLDNLTKCWGIVAVDPDQRRRGIGSALVRQVRTRLAQEGRTTMVTETAYPFDRREDHPYRQFAVANGFRVANDEICRILALPVDPALLEALATQAAPHHTAYRIETFVGSLPEQLLASYCALQNQLGVDAPTGDVDFEAESMTPQLWLERLAEDREVGRTRFATVALDESGEVVAYTDLVLPPLPSVDVWQWGTLVHRNHRGHRLGMAVKVRNLAQLAGADTGRVRVLTSNAETNAQMVDINLRLGFEAVEVCPMFELRIDSSAAGRGEQRAQVSAATS
jgi:GNAT superfamily N-acetyltransferase